MITIDISSLYAETGTAKLTDIPVYEDKIKKLTPPGSDVTITGHGPVWLYLRLAHALHGIARILIYDSPVTGPVVIFNHNPR
ncbi:MAG: hypothetical protein H7A51_04345 [Akkermansiaceae bacterium]|nr:hypothetical protein [Akkermansiaceae bacterium]